VHLEALHAEWLAPLELKTLRRDQREAIAAAAED
jgi:hypothetical protein